MLAQDPHNYCVICEKHCEYAMGFAVCTAEKCKTIESWDREPNE